MTSAKNPPVRGDDEKAEAKRLVELLFSTLRSRARSDEAFLTRLKECYEHTHQKPPSSKLNWKEDNGAYRQLFNISDNTFYESRRNITPNHLKHIFHAIEWLGCKSSPFKEDDLQDLTNGNRYLREILPEIPVFELVKRPETEHGNAIINSLNLYGFAALIGANDQSNIVSEVIDRYGWQFCTCDATKHRSTLWTNILRYLADRERQQANVDAGVLRELKSEVVGFVRKWSDGMKSLTKSEQDLIEAAHDIIDDGNVRRNICELIKDNASTLRNSEIVADLARIVRLGADKSLIIIRNVEELASSQEILEALFGVPSTENGANSRFRLFVTSQKPDIFAFWGDAAKDCTRQINVGDEDNRVAEVFLGYLEIVIAELSKESLILSDTERSLMQIWQPLLAVPMPGTGIDGRQKNQPPDQVLAPLDELVKDRPEVVILGESGSGKSEGLKRQALTAAQEAQAKMGAWATKLASTLPDRVPARLDGLVKDTTEAAILGEFGSGKSEWLKRQALYIAQQAKEKMDAEVSRLETITLPIFLRVSELGAALSSYYAAERKDVLLRSYRTEAPEDQLGTPEILVALAICVAVRTRFGARASNEIDRFLFRRLLDRADNLEPSILLCLDAWDEAPESSQKVLDDYLPVYLANNAGTMRVRITSRPISWIMRTTNWNPLAVFIQPFSETTQGMFIEKFFASRNDGAAKAEKLLNHCRTRSTLRELARVPLLATLLCLIYESDEQVLERRGDLYERTLVFILTKWAKANRQGEQGKIAAWIETKSGQDQMLWLLGALAERCFGRDEITQSQIIELIDGEPGRQQGVYHRAGAILQRWIDDIGVEYIGPTLAQFGVFYERNTGFSFLHPAFQEWLAVRTLLSRAKSDGWLAIRDGVDHIAWSPEWAEEVLLLAESLDDPEPLLRLLSDIDRDDILRSRTRLAALALPRISKDKRDRCASVVGHITETIVDGAFDEFQWPGEPSHFTSALPSLAAANGAYCGMPFREWLKAAIRKPSSVLHKQSTAGSTTTPKGKLASMWASLMRVTEGTRRNIRPEYIRLLGYASAVPETPELYIVLAQLLAHDDQSIRMEAAKVIGAICGGASAASAQLLAEHELAFERETRLLVRRFANREGRQAILSGLAGQLTGWHPWDRRSAAQAIGDLGRDAATQEVLSALARNLTETPTYKGLYDWNLVIEEVLLAIGRLGAAAANDEILSALAHFIEHAEQDDQGRRRYDAVRAVWGMGPEAAKDQFLQNITRLLAERDEDTRIWASIALQKVGTRGGTPEILSALGKMLADENRRIRGAGANTIGWLGPHVAIPDEFIPRLRRMLLPDERADDRLSAIFALSKHGGVAAFPEISQVLEELLVDKESDVRLSAVLAVNDWSNELRDRTSAVLADLLRDKNWHIQMRAAEIVESYGRTAATEEILSALGYLLAEEKQWMVFARAQEAVSKIGRVAARKDILSAVAHRLSDKDGFIVGRAARIISELGAHAQSPELLGCLAPLLQRRDPNGMAIARGWRDFRFVRAQSVDATWIPRPVSRAVAARLEGRP